MVNNLSLSPISRLTLSTVAVTRRLQEKKLLRKLLRVFMHREYYGWSSLMDAVAAQLRFPIQCVLLCVIRLIRCGLSVGTDAPVPLLSLARSTRALMSTRKTPRQAFVFLLRDAIANRSLLQKFCRERRESYRATLGHSKL